MAFVIPRRLRANASATPARLDWLTGLPELVNELALRWELSVGAPFDSDEVSAAWVAPATRRGGESVVLKIAMPHMEAEQEIDGLRHWAGDPTVRLLGADQSLNAMLLERCVPGTSLRAEPEPEQDRVIAELLRRMWRPRDGVASFRPLTQMIEFWIAEARRRLARRSDHGLVEQAIQVLRELSRPSVTDVLLGTDVHAGNVLRAEREPWLVIDPKPFVGDPAYDATQHLINCADRVVAHPHDTVARFADLLEVDADRVRLWLFGRAALEGADAWQRRAPRIAQALRGANGS